MLSQEGFTATLRQKDGKLLRMEGEGIYGCVQGFDGHYWYFRSAPIDGWTNPHKATSSPEIGSWSQRVDGLRARLSIKEGQRLDDAHRLLDVYLELENSSGGAIAFSYDETLRPPMISCEVLDEGGKPKEQIHPIVIDYEQAYPSGFRVFLPAPESSFRFKVSIAATGISGKQIQMPCGM